MGWVETRITRTTQPQDVCGVSNNGLPAPFEAWLPGISPFSLVQGWKPSVEATFAKSATPAGVGFKVSATGRRYTQALFGGQTDVAWLIVALNNGVGGGAQSVVRKDGVLTPFQDDNGGLRAVAWDGNGLALRPYPSGYRGLAVNVLTGTRTASALVLGLNDRVDISYGASGAVSTGVNSLCLGAADDGFELSTRWDILALAVWQGVGRIPGAAQMKVLRENPWAIFEPEVTRIWVDSAASVTLPTLVQPNGTTSAGAWTATGAASLHGAINELVPSDTQYISVNSASTTEMLLGEAAFPGGVNQTLAYRASSTQGSTFTITLKQGATQIMTRTHSLTGTDTLYTQTLTAPEIALITAGAISVTLTTS